MKKATAGAVCGILALAVLAGCGSVDGSQAAITVDDETIDLGTATFDLRMQQAQITEMMDTNGLLSGDTSGRMDFWDTVFGSDNPDGLSYGAQTKQSVQDDLVKRVLLRRHASDYGLELPENVQEELTEVAAVTYEKNEDVLKSIGTTEEDIREALELSSYRTLMYDTMTADADTDISDEEAAQSKLLYVRYDLSELDEQNTDVDGEAKTREDIDAEMQAVLDLLKEDPDITEEDLSAKAEEIAEDVFVYHVSYGDRDEGILPEEVLEAAAGLEDGEVYDGVLETSNNYLYALRMEAVFDEEATEIEKTEIANERKEELYNEIVQGWVDGAEVTTSEAWDKLILTDDEKWIAMTTEKGLYTGDEE